MHARATHTWAIVKVSRLMEGYARSSVAFFRVDLVCGIGVKRGASFFDGLCVEVSVREKALEWVD